MAQQGMFDGVILLRVPLTLRLCRRGLRADEAPFRPARKRDKLKSPHRAGLSWVPRPRQPLRVAHTAAAVLMARVSHKECYKVPWTLCPSLPS